MELISNLMHYFLWHVGGLHWKYSTCLLSSGWYTIHMVYREHPKITPNVGRWWKIVKDSKLFPRAQPWRDFKRRKSYMKFEIQMKFNCFLKFRWNLSEIWNSNEIYLNFEFWNLSEFWNLKPKILSKIFIQLWDTNFIINIYMYEPKNLIPKYYPN